jgi:hypothetical protein
MEKSNNNHKAPDIVELKNQREVKLKEIETLEKMIKSLDTKKMEVKCCICGIEGDYLCSVCLVLFLPV